MPKPSPIAALVLLALPSAPAALQEVGLYPIAPNDIEGNGLYGNSVDIEGTTAVVGGPRYVGSGTCVGSGAVFVIDTETAELLTVQDHTPCALLDHLGASVAIDAGRVLATLGAKNGSSRAYLFDAATGAELQVFPTSTSGLIAAFGASADLAGNVALIGDPGWRPSFGAPERGAVYAYDAATGALLHELEEASDSTVEFFGEAVATDGTIAVCGAPRADDGGADRGTAFGYELATGGRLATLEPAGLGAGDRFGASVAVGGGHVAVSAPGDDELGDGAGKVYVFDAGSAALLHELTASDGSAGHAFGRALDIDGSLLAVGSVQSAGAPPGRASVYVFDLASGDELYALTAAASTPTPQFGYELALSGGRLVHGYYADSSVAQVAGIAKLFELPSELSATPATLSASAGGTQLLSLDGRPTQQGNFYAILGSATGTSPGVPIGFWPGAPAVPLNWDPYYVFTVNHVGVGGSPLSGSLGVLDPDGRASAAFHLPAGSSPSVVGLVLHHAFVVIDPTPLPGQPMLDAASTAASVQIVP